MSIMNLTILGMFIFSVGSIGVIARSNIFVIYMSLELMLNGLSLILVAFSTYNHSFDGQILTLFVIALAAAEAALFLTVIVLLFRTKRSLDSNIFTSLKKG